MWHASPADTPAPFAVKQGACQKCFEWVAVRGLETQVWCVCMCTPLVCVYAYTKQVCPWSSVRMCAYLCIINIYRCTQTLERPIAHTHTHTHTHTQVYTICVEATDRSKKTAVFETANSALRRNETCILVEVPKCKYCVQVRKYVCVCMCACTYL
jgi:hypothetical protein